MPRSKPSDITVTDQFCGAGGSSVGFSKAGGRLILGLNHWQRAIDTHNANFPDADHDCVDMSATDPRRYRSSNILISSPECTNHSIAKGRKVRHQRQMQLTGKIEIPAEDERSRATMWDVPRFAEYHNYEYIIVENVVDIRFWVMWDAWLHAMELLGYDHKEVYFNSMFAHMKPSPSLRLENGDFAAQSRDRIYVVFWKKGNHAPDLELRPSGYCEHCLEERELIQSWKNPRKQYGRFGERRQYVYRCPVCAEMVMPYYYASANIIDWTLPMPLVSDRDYKGGLKPRTIERIQVGLDRFKNEPVLMLMSHTHGRHENKVKSLDQPGFTQTTREEMGLMTPLIVPFRGTVSGYASPLGIDEALSTVIASGIQHGIVTPPFIMHNTMNANPSSLADPIHTVVAQGNTQYVVAPAPFLINKLPANHSYRGVGEELQTVTTANTYYVVGRPFLIQLLQQRQAAQDIKDPMATITTENHFYLVQPPFVLSYYGVSGLNPVTEAIPTITAKARHSLITQDVRPEDCGFRMLEPHEIQAAQAFPSDYIFTTTTKREKVKMVGNAVTPPVMQRLAERCIAALEGNR